MTYAEAAAWVQRMTLGQRRVVVLGWVLRRGMDPDAAEEEMRKLMEFDISKKEER